MKALMENEVEDLEHETIPPQNASASIPQREETDLSSKMQNEVRSRSSALTLGAALTELCGLLSIGGGFFMSLISSNIGSFSVTLGIGAFVCGAISMILGLPAVAGGLFAWRQEYWNRAFIGSVSGLLGAFFTFGVLGGALGFVALVLITFTWPEFEKSSPN
jgi:hypothetical protein